MDNHLNNSGQLSSRSQVHVRDEFRDGSVQKLSISFKYREFDQRTLSSSINQIVEIQVYGTIVKVHVSSKGKLTSRPVLLSVSPYQMSSLCLIDKRNVQYSQFSIFDIIQVFTDQIPAVLLTKHNQDFFLIISIRKSLNTTKTIYLEFSMKQQRDLIQQAIQHFCIEETYKMQFLNYVEFIREQVLFTNNNDNEKQLTRKEMKVILARYRIDFDCIEHQFIGDQNQSSIFFTNTKFRLIKALSLNEFCENLPLVLAKEETREIFQKYASRSTNITDNFKGCMTIREFQNFLEEEQGVFLETNQVEDLILNLKQNEKQDGLSFINFSEYLFSTNNEIMVQQDLQDEFLDQPLNEYFINSAYGVHQFNLTDIHLLKNIQNIDESIEPLIFVLLRGVRHIELEIWEGLTNIPICYYGPMQNFQVSLIDLLKVIKNYAFKTTSNPLIIWLEDHCRMEQKMMINEEFMNILGDLIVRAKDLYRISLLSLPNLRQLQKKIIIYGSIRIKKHQHISSEPEIKRSQSQFSPSNYEDEGVNLKNNNMDHFKKTNLHLSQTRHKNFLVHQTFIRGPTSNRNIKTQELIDISTTLVEQLKEKFALSGIQHNYSMFQVPVQLSSDLIDKIIIYDSSDQLYQNILNTKKQSQNLYRQKLEYSELNSVSSDHTMPLENMLMKECSLTNNHLLKWSKSLNKQQFNINPSQGFLQQVQLIMIKHHMIDYNYMYYYAMFNGYYGIMSGYVHRPQKHHQTSAQMSKRQSISMFSQQSVLSQESPVRFLTVKVISGRQLINKSGKLKEAKIFVQVILREPKYCENEKCQQEVTNKVEGNTFNPVFNKEMAFEIQSFSSFYSVIMFIVYDNDFNNMLYWNSMSVRNIRQGYRVVPLLDEKLNSIFNTYLFVKIRIN